jgi:hypothetical protein
MIPPGGASLKVGVPTGSICGYTCGGDDKRLRMEVGIGF